jgi:hypothetical protein
MAAPKSSGTSVHGRLAGELKRLQYDVRLQEWYVSRGKMSRQELNQYIAALPDNASNVESNEVPAPAAAALAAAPAQDHDPIN